jgi:hypothetical protein
MNPVFIAVTRREYILVGSAPASLLETVTSTNTELMSLSGMWDYIEFNPAAGRLR